MNARIMTVAGLAFLLVPAAGAQRKISGTENCHQPEIVSATNAGDMEGHILAVQKNTCTWTTGMEMEGAKAKDGSGVEFVEIWPTRASSDGTYVGNMDNGDKFFVSYHGSVTLKDGAPTGPVHGTWSYTGGTGKLKGITGKGTFTATPNPDGSSEIDVEGDYTIPPPAAPKAATPKP